MQKILLDDYDMDCDKILDNKDQVTNKMLGVYNTNDDCKGLVLTADQKNKKFKITCDDNSTLPFSIDWNYFADNTLGKTCTHKLTDLFNIQEGGSRFQDPAPFKWDNLYSKEDGKCLSEFYIYVTTGKKATCAFNKEISGKKTKWYDPSNWGGGDDWVCCNVSEYPKTSFCIQWDDLNESGGDDHFSRALDKIFNSCKSDGVQSIDNFKKLVKEFECFNDETRASRWQ
jgi:hypothetical protein